MFGEKLYLSPVLDLYNGEIITYTIGSRPTYSLVSEMLETTLERFTRKSPTIDAFRSRVALSNETICPDNQEVLCRVCLEKEAVLTTQ